MIVVTTDFVPGKKIIEVLGIVKGNTIRVVYEAGPAGFDLYNRLTADSIERCFEFSETLFTICTNSR